MRFSEATGRKIVSTSTAETVGKVDAFVVDPHRRVVVAVECRKTSGGDVLPWADIVGFGADAVTVRDAAAIGGAGPEVDALRGKDHSVLGKRVLSSAGDELGKVDDVAFDAETGAIEALVLTGGDIAGDRLLSVGSYAVIVAVG